MFLRRFHPMNVSGVGAGRVIGNALKGLAIKPYPKELEEQLTLRNGERVLLRPIRPEDEAAHQEFFTHLGKYDVYFRFFGFVKGFSHAEMMRYTQIDYENEMAFVAIGETGETKGRTLGVARAVGIAKTNDAEFAVVVRSDFKGMGLGYGLLGKIIRYSKERGWTGLSGQVLTENGQMLELARDLGFKPVGRPERGVTNLYLDLNAENAK